MFIAELDRPWLETPFLLQGFLIEEDAQIVQLQKYCRSVLVDRSRSIGRHHALESRSADPKPRRPPTAFLEVEEAQPDDFAAICRILRQQTGSRRYDRPPRIEPQDGQSRLEAELLYSAPIFEDIKRSLGAIRDALARGDRADVQQVGSLVHEMAQGVERNPEAMLWLARLKSTDQYSYDHAVDVSVHLMVFGKFLGMPAKTVEKLGLAGLMQDIGKTDIPPDILNKPGDLTPDEYALVQAHVATSLEILIGSPGFTVDVLNVVASHHERFDGSGYPRRLKGETISLHAELAGLVDSYCAMIRERSYESAIPCQKALERLIKVRGIKFREALVDQFVQCIGLYPIGSLVELNTGEVAVVIQQNQVRRLKPRVLLVLAPDKSYERNPRTLDLMMEPATPTGEPYRITRALPPDAYGIDPAELFLD